MIPVRITILYSRVYLWVLIFAIFYDPQNIAPAKLFSQKLTVSYGLPMHISVTYSRL